MAKIAQRLADIVPSGHDTGLPRRCTISRGCSVQEIIELALVAAVPRQTEVNRESSLQTLVE
ncbi:MAG: hypothetical protein ACLRP3_08325 [Escherichia sp.]